MENKLKDFENVVRSAHPDATFQGLYEDLYILLSQVAEEKGHGVWDNGGEVIGNITISPAYSGWFCFTYLLVNDDCSKELKLTVHAKLNGGIIDIKQIAI